MQDRKAMYALTIWSWQIKLLDWKKNIKSCLGLTEAKKYKSQKTMKEIERELQVIQKKKQSPLTVDDLLGNSVIEAPFPNIRPTVIIFISTTIRSCQ